MCGIFGYTGTSNCTNLLINGLERLEYRGYDSAGIALVHNNTLYSYKVKGRVSFLHEKASSFMGSTGIAHTRWATHGAPNMINAHPHLDTAQSLAVVHNGIIENHQVLRSLLEKKDHYFVSETDSEVLAHLIADEYKKSSDLVRAVKAALMVVKGAFGIAVVHKEYPDTIVVARKGSPLVIGILPGARIVASDPSAIIEHTKEVVYLSDNDLAVLTPNSHKVFSLLDEKESFPKESHIDWDLSQIEKGGYDYFMLKEIYEQPLALEQAIAGKMAMIKEKGLLSSLNLSKEHSLTKKRLIIIACGTSWHAGLVAKNYFEQLAGMWVEVAYASELRYGNVNISSDDVVIAISQSGETSDTLEALKLCKEKGAFTLGVVNVVGSSIARLVDGGLYLHAGPEIGVASTKAFTTQIITLFFIAVHFGMQKGLVSNKDLDMFDNEITLLLDSLKVALSSYDVVRSFAKKYVKATNALYLGRGLHFPVALEGALKLKEISYVHAEGLPAAEMKHGPIALIDEHMPVVVLAPFDELYGKILSNIQEVKARGGRIIIITTVDDPHLRSLADEYISIPQVHALFQPIISVIPLQFLAYEMAVLRGCDVDKPKNLAKSVTVE